MQRLEGRVAIVTGGASGIGRATVERFLSEGARVAVWDLDPKALAQESSPEANGMVQLETLDVRDPSAVRRATVALLEKTRRIDILVNNAGLTFGYLPAESVTARQWSAILDTNARGALHCVQAVVPVMKQLRYGRIVNSSSILARVGFPGQTVYAAAKAALVGMTRTWAQEFGPFGITVNAVAGGYIDTPMNAANPPEMIRQALDRTPLGRLGTPEDVASAYLFLASEEAGFVTGAILQVDGGLLP